MSQSLIDASMRAAIALLKSIESLQDSIDDAATIDASCLHDIQFDLVVAHKELTDELSLVLGLDAAKVARDVIVSEMESMRTVLRAMAVAPC